jgi:hypothetical protein
MARIAASLPGPGPLINRSASCNPSSFPLVMTCSAANRAAYGVLFRDPVNPADPELAQTTALPCRSVIVTIVLLNVACI